MRKRWLGCESLGELRVIYFPTNWGAKEPQNLPNHRVDGKGFLVELGSRPWDFSCRNRWQQIILQGRKAIPLEKMNEMSQEKGSFYKRKFHLQAIHFRDMLVFRGVILKKGMYSTHANHTKSILEGVDDSDTPYWRSAGMLREFHRGKLRKLSCAKIPMRKKTAILWHDSSLVVSEHSFLKTCQEFTGLTSTKIFKKKPSLFSVYRP